MAPVNFNVNPLAQYCPHAPEPPQQRFLDLDCMEALYGGAAGGGKSDALLMAALQYVHVPGYAAILLRKTYADLARPGALMDRAEQWLAGTDARWQGSKTRWLFPSGATLSFGYVERYADVFQYQSSEFQFIGWDELTQHEERCYRYLFSRLRRLKTSPVPVRVRGATNPGGVGHDWVKMRFVDQETATAPFIPALLRDNPHVDQEEYLKALGELDDITRKQLEEGDWDVVAAGELFQREWFKDHIIAEPFPGCTWIRYWDKAGTAGGTGAFTAGVLMGVDPQGRYVTAHVERGRWGYVERNEHIKAIAERDGKNVDIWEEQEPGSGGKESAQITVKELAGWVAQYETVTGNKIERARPLASQAKAGNFYVVQAPWTSAYINELVAASLDAAYMDQVDASSGAFNKLALLARTRNVSPSNLTQESRWGRPVINGGLRRPSLGGFLEH